MKEDSTRKARLACFQLKSAPSVRRFTCVAAAIVGALPAVSSAATPAIDAVKNLKVGMSLHELQQLDGDGFQGSDFDCHVFGVTAACVSGDTTVAQIKALVSVHFVATIAVPELAPAELRSMSDEQRAMRAREIASGLKAAAIRVKIDADEHTNFLRAYVAKNGAPRTSDERTFSNLFGAQFKGKSSHWEGRGVIADIWERCGSATDACLLVQSPKLVELMSAAAGLSPEARVKDL